MLTLNPDIETCDIRLTKINADATAFEKVEWMDVAFFRFGYFNYQKMNLIDMVNKFTSDVWYQVDLLVDWEG